MSPAERPEERTKRGDKAQAPVLGQEEPEGGQVTGVGRETGGPRRAQRLRERQLGWVSVRGSGEESGKRGLRRRFLGKSRGQAFKKDGERSTARGGKKA